MEDIEEDIIEVIIKAYTIRVERGYETDKKDIILPKIYESEAL